MAEWKKVVVSGSAAELNSLTLAGSAGSITNASTVAATKLTGSFTGSFTGDGSGLTNIPGGVSAGLLVFQTGSGTNSIKPVEGSPTISNHGLDKLGIQVPEINDDTEDIIIGFVISSDLNS